VVTVEPGLYINPLHTQRWQAEKRHESFIDYAMFERHASLGGIRIEDDVLVTSQGARVLGPAIPKARGEVEALASLM
jgi:Xaa-Pro aminopeptidase/Xaa-Pro dipeptidase